MNNQKEANDLVKYEISHELCDKDNNTINVQNNYKRSLVLKKEKTSN